MRFALFGLPLLASAAVLVQRDGASINTAIGYVQGNITVVNNSVSKLKMNDSIDGIIILFQTSALQKSVNNAASVANASAALSESESGSVANSVISLEQSVMGLLNNLVAHKPEFQTVILGHDGSFLVKSNLQSSKKSADAFGAALVPKLTSDYQSAAPIIIQQIDDAFNKAIAAFS